MPALDFREIPAANNADGRQDTFELFARDFLDFIGFTVVDGPDRGADTGRDLIVEELRTGVGGRSQVRWLVSCKHNVTGASVTPRDEPNILDRVRAKNCTGFIGFYSTLPSAGLGTRLRELTDIETTVWDHERIESRLLTSQPGLTIARRYFPTSFSNWGDANPRPAELMYRAEPLFCEACGRDLLPPVAGIMVTLSEVVESGDRESVVDVYFCCKGACDHRLRSRYASNYQELVLTDGWKDIPEIAIPTVYLRAVMGIINELFDGTVYRQPAIEKYKTLLVSLFPHVSRRLTDQEREEVTHLLRMPSWLGGLG